MGTGSEEDVLWIHSNDPDIEGTLTVMGEALTEETRQRVTTCTDMPVLDLWFDRAIDATTLDEVFAAPSATDRIPAPAQSPEQTGIPSQSPGVPGSSTD
ncbi:hypothetical protein [Streptomyces nodosus]|uniref:hypothetical protein n=1 Tax=Streptomyces nodosus TaxID=40318 RepID=UPI0005BE8FB7|nr:hypothetical protein [Streptomyces nodosus]MBB4790410.1 hypothetical protein [Streptomyces nodosus]